VTGEISFTLSHAALDLLWADLGLGAPPQLLLEDPRVNDRVDQGAALLDAVYRDLASRNLVVRGRLIAGVVDALALLHRFDWAVDGAIMPANGGEAEGFRAAINGRSAVLARRRGAFVEFRAVDPAAAVDVVVSLIGTLKPGLGASLTYPATDAAPAPESGTVLRPARDGGQHDAQRRAVQAILTKPRTRLGWFSVVGRDRGGRPVRSAPISWLDTVDGRYLRYERPGPDGRQWWTCTPADATRIAHVLRTAL
jgi:hypothetical protein